MARLHARPLTERDQDLYVERAADRRLTAVLDNGENVLLTTNRGSGTTSLLYHLEDALPDGIYVAGDRAASGAELLASVTARLGLPASFLPDLGALVRRPDPLASPPQLRELATKLRADDRRPVVLVDGPVDPAVAFELFGRWRDDVYAVPLTWLVVAHQNRLREYLTPPADVFYEHLIHLDDFDVDQARSILAARAADAELRPEDRDAILEAFDGTPRHLLRLARERLARAEEDSPSRLQSHVEATRELSRGAHMLLAEMQGRGPVSATDRELRDRLGVTDRQMRRNLHELAATGLVEAAPPSRSGPGRPAATYQLSPIGTTEASR